MAQCEMCSQSVDNPKTVLVEGVEMKVCSKCEKYGNPVNKKKIPQHMIRNAQRVFRKQVKRGNVDDNKYVKENAGAVIKAAREKLGIRQIDLSRKLSISESEIHQVESGHLAPTLALARKFEQGLHIKLVGEYKEDEEKERLYDFKAEQEQTKAGVTIGDMIKIKKKK